MGSRLKHAWNAFLNKDPTPKREYDGIGYTIRPDRPRFTRGNEKSIVTAVYNRIALDVAAINIRHCQLDGEGRYVETLKTSLNNCLSVEANIDQTGRAFIQDIVMSMLDEGCVAIVPIDTDINPKNSGSYDIETMRTGKILEWKPKEIKVRIYNDQTGQKEEVWVPKKIAAIVENPLYAVINEPNSTMKRLSRKLSLLDVTDEQTASGKLDLIIQLPYVIKTDTRREQAENRRKDIENQLAGSKYGIAYTDGTEKITQLNRSLENNLMGQVEYLTNLLFSQLGLTQAILDGTADEQAMLNYYNRTIEPIASAIIDEMIRKFLTKTARTQNKTIMAFRDPFKLVPVNNIAEIADKFTRNEIMTSNEIRQVIGMKPSNDPKADQLVNSNISQPTDGNMMMPQSQAGMSEEDYNMQMQNLDDLDAQLDQLSSEFDDDLKHYASPYYDPVKAHEYYMRTRELKGTQPNTSTSSLNEEGKRVADYVKKTLGEERDTKIEGHSNQTKNQIQSLSDKKANDVEQHTAQMNVKIEGLRNKIKAMDSQQKSANKERILKQIDVLRKDNQRKRESLQEAFNGSRKELQETHKTAREGYRSEYKQKLADEIAKIGSEAKYRKVKKAKSKKS